VERKKKEELFLIVVIEIARIVDHLNGMEYDRGDKSEREKR
jgi:hypothetical protein